MFVNLKLDLASNIESVPVLFSRTILGIKTVLSVATWQGLKDGHGLKLEKVGLTF